MSTQVAQPAPAKTRGAVAVFEPPRLPWHDAIGDRFGDLGVTRTTWKVLVEAIWPAAKTVNSVVMALSYCQSRKLDPFKRVVHIVPVWDSARGGYIETVWPAIAELRTTAFRTGQYAGCDETQFGPEVTKTFKGKVKRDGKWVDDEKTVTFPEWAQITVYRIINGVRVPFVGPKVYWLETYARMEPSELPNRMWERRTHGQQEKCAEAGALRKAFPEELGNEYAAEEMEGQRLGGEPRDVTPKAPPATIEIPDFPVPAVVGPTTGTSMPEAAPLDDDGWPGPSAEPNLLTDLEGRLKGAKPQDIAKVEQEMGQVIMSSDEATRTRAVELIEAAKKRKKGE